MIERLSAERTRAAQIVALSERIVALDTSVFRERATEAIMTSGDTVAVGRMRAARAAAAALLIVGLARPGSTITAQSGSRKPPSPAAGLLLVILNQGASALVTTPGRWAVGLHSESPSFDSFVSRR